MERTCALLVALALLVGACAGDPGADDEAASGAGDGLVVVTSVFPAAWLAQRIAPAARLTHLAPGGHGVHDLTLSPGDRAELARADVVLFVGEVGFQPQVEDAVEDADGEVVSLAEVAGDRLLAFPTPGGAAHGHDRGEDGSEQPVGHGDHQAPVDPHVWFDPEIMAQAAEAVGQAFAAADPERAEAYRANAEAAAAELERVGAYADDRLGGDCAHDAAVVSHQAYQYLLEPYGLAQIGISGAGGHATATPQRIAELTQRIRHQGIPAVLAEPLEGRRDAEALAREAGVDLVDVHPLGSVGDQRRQRGLPALLREQVDAFAGALGCP